MNTRDASGRSTPLPIFNGDQYFSAPQDASGPQHCKTWRPKLALLVLLSAIFCLHARGQNYDMDWYKVAGGGSTSAGGVYQVSGTIGQQDAGLQLIGGNYSLTGGFWSLIAAVQTPGAPTLRVFLTITNTAVIAWPAPSTGFILQYNSDLNTTTWRSAPNSVNLVGSENQVIISAPSGNQFYRLMK